MNIFLLHENPDTAATALLDKHVNKICLEAVQIANTGLHLAGAGDLAFYGATHKSHPWCEFASESFDHWQFVRAHAHAIGREFLRRYGSRHGSHEKSLQNWTHDELTAIADALGRGSVESFPQAMPEQYQQADAIDAYRAYYRSDKWAKNWAFYRKVEPPAWFIEGTPYDRWF